VDIAYRCDQLLRCTFVSWHGEVTPDEVHAHSDRMFFDPAFPPGPNVLCDLRPICASVPGTNDNATREIGGSWTSKARVLPNLRVALVTDKRTRHGVRRIVTREIVTATIDFVLFDDVDAAAEWLGVDAVRAAAILEELRTPPHRTKI
jgi:hypothetical protein